MSVVGRDAELALLENALRAEAAGAGVVMVGAAGIGKTTLWDATVKSARALGFQVLAARSSGGETQLPFAGLIDLCDGIGRDDLAGLPPPQRAALEVALLRAEPPARPLQSAAVALGLLGAIRSIAARGPIVIAIDDLQWLDQASSDLLVFVARRAVDLEVRFLLARRPARTGALEQVLTRQGLERLRVVGLSLGAIRHLLFERLGLTLSRQLLRRIVDMTEGNPLFALEVGRSVIDAGAPTVAEEIPLPDSVEEMLGVRVGRLPPAVRRVLLAVALNADARVDQIIAVTDAGAIDDAIDAGVVEIDGNRARASHPLLAAAVERHARARERRELHLALAGVAAEEQLRVLHLALASTRSDARLAASLAAAAEDACARGARRRAVLLAGHALRLTPDLAPERPDRVLMLAEHLDEAGDLHRLTALLEEEMESLPTATMRSRAWLLLSDGEGAASVQDENRYLERALAEGGADRNARAGALAKLADNAAAAAVENLREAESWALEAVRNATEARLRTHALQALAWVRALTGRPVDDLCDRSRVREDPSAHISSVPERVAAQRLIWRGELEAARSLLDSLAALTDEHGEPTSFAMVRLHVCELALRAGELDAASLILDEWAESSDYVLQFRPQYHRLRAVLAAGRGEVEEAKRWATDAIQRSRAVECRWDELEALRARAMAALLRGAPAQAVEDLRQVWERCEREGPLDPGAFPVAPELVEALVELGDLGAAGQVTDQLHRLATQQDHPWAKATATRCSALVALASSQDHEAAAASLADAAEELESMGLRFDAARCQLALGRALRRAKRWRAARERLETAAEQFGALGSIGWEERARAELARVGARKRGADDRQLTPSERRVAELAAEGLPNKQIAGMLYVTVNTVEVHLSRSYAKLGVRSRSQLAKALGARS